MTNHTMTVVSPVCQKITRGAPSQNSSASITGHLSDDEQPAAMLATEEPLACPRALLDLVDLDGGQRLAARGAHAVLERADTDAAVTRAHVFVELERVRRDLAAHLV